MDRGHVLISGDTRPIWHHAQVSGTPIGVPGARSAASPVSAGPAGRAGPGARPGPGALRAPVPGPGLRHRQRAVGTLLIAGGLVLGAAALPGRSTVLLAVLSAQVVLVVLGPRLLPSADRWALAGAVPAPVASVVVGAAAGGHLGLGRFGPAPVLVAAFAAAVLVVVVTELARAARRPAGEVVAAVPDAVGPGEGRVERLSQNLTVSVLALSPALALAVAASAGPRRYWVALGIAEVAAGFGVRLGGSVVRAGGLSAGELLRSPHRTAELLRLPVARAIAVDVAASVLALLATGGLLLAERVGSAAIAVPALLALVATPLVLAGATTVLGLRAPVGAGLLAAALGLALGAPLALLLSVRPG